VILHATHHGKLLSILLFTAIFRIAYHYYMMNLRYLIVAVDEKSTSSPSRVLDAWRGRISIEEWTHTSNYSDMDFDLIFLREHGDPKLIDPKDRIRFHSNLYVDRQAAFYQSCAVHLKLKNRTWTSFHDVDEFLVVPKHVNVSDEDIRKPGIIPRIIERYSQLDVLNVVVDAKDPSLVQNWSLWFSVFPCVNIPRVLFGAVSSSDEEVSRDVPDFLDARRFETLNWRHQGTSITSSDGPGKSIIDVRRLPADVVARARHQISGTPHRPFPEHCTHAWAIPAKMPIVIHHYLGSWEAYSYRKNDIRKGVGKTLQIWQKLSKQRAAGTNDDARSWISGFVRMVGSEAAKVLLRDSGLPRDYLMTENETEAWNAL
jgi:hypothetical protein